MTDFTGKMTEDKSPKGLKFETHAKIDSLITLETETSPATFIASFSRFWAAAPKGLMTYAITDRGNFSFSFSFSSFSVHPPIEAHILASRPEF